MGPWGIGNILKYCKFVLQARDSLGFWGKNSFIGCVSGDGSVKEPRNLPMSLSVNVCSGRTWGKKPLKLWIRILCFWRFLISIFSGRNRWVDSTLWRHLPHLIMPYGSVIMNMEIIKKSVSYLSDKLTFLPHMLVIMAESPLSKSSWWSVLNHSSRFRLRGESRCHPILLAIT